MKKAALILLLIAYLPLFFFSSEGNLGVLFNDIYGIFTAIGISLFLISDYLKTKDVVFVPTASIFGVIGLIFLLNTLVDGLYQTYKPIFISIITLNLCYVFLFIKSIWRRF